MYEILAESEGVKQAKGGTGDKGTGERETDDKETDEKGTGERGTDDKEAGERGTDDKETDDNGTGIKVVDERGRCSDIQCDGFDCKPDSDGSVCGLFKGDAGVSARWLAAAVVVDWRGSGRLCGNGFRTAVE